MNTCAIIIPARLSSQRFPRKLLHPICGKPLILWTAENLKQAKLDWPIFFAVEDQELLDLLKHSGFNAILTGTHASGTDRIAEANRQVKADLVINIQADEPLTGAHHVKMLFDLMQGGADMGTLAHRISNNEDFTNPNRVKVVCGASGQALYFSRSPIPHPRASGVTKTPSHAFLHLGMYAYTAEFLEAFQKLPTGTLEGIEKLEQLRALENGYNIQVGITSETGFGVDAPEDAISLERILKK